MSLLLLFLCSSTGTHTHTQRKNFAVSENGYDESRIAPLGNFLSFFSSLPKTRAFVTGVIILFHLLYFFFRLFNVNKHSSSCLCLGSYKEGLVLHSYSHIQAELLDIQNFCSKRGWTWAGSFKQNLLYKAWQVRPEVLPKQDELLNSLVSVVGRQN